MRALVIAALVALAAACGTPQDTGAPDAGSGIHHVVVDMQGSAQLHPLEKSWRTATKAADVPLAGATVAVEDALGAVRGAPPLKTSTVAADGSWSVSGVDVTNVTLAVVGVVRDLPTIMQSGYGIQRGRPEQSLKDLPLYVLSKEFVAQLQTASGLTDLESTGFIFGVITDKDGKGLAGAQFASMSPTPKAVVPADDEDLVYLNDDLSGKADGDKTSASGAFLYVPSASKGATEYSAVKEGTQFQSHLSGKRAGACISVFIEAK